MARIDTSGPFASNTPALTYEKALETLLNSEWTVVSEGPSGAQLIGEKKMRTQTKVALVIGAVLVFAAGIGLIVMAFALIDYWMTKAPTHFLSRSVPSYPEA